MGLLDGILGKKNGSPSSRDGGSVSADRVQEEYQRLKEAGKTHPGNLLVRMGDLHRDMGQPPKAIQFYEAAAEQFVREESWSLAEATVRRVAQLNDGPTRRTLLCLLETGLGRRMPAMACASIDDLSSRLKPSDGAEIERMVEIVDTYALSEPSVDMALAEFLCGVGRPERAVERLHVALRAAQAKGDERLVEEVRGRLGDLDPIGDSVRPARDEPIAAPTPAPVAPAPAVEPAVPDRAPAGAAVRVLGRDGRTDGRDDDDAVRDLIRQLRSGLDEHIAPEDGETHFDLGFAFLEMRLFDEAVREFTLAYGSDEYRIRAAQGLAQALIEGGEPAKADGILGSVRPEISADDSSHGLLYWHARAHEAVARREEALALYHKIARADPGFQDVERRIADLEA